MAADGFKEREEAFEAKYKHDQDLLFRINVRTAKLLGLWAAEQMGLSGAEADAYAKQVVEADFEEPGFEDVLRKVAGDFTRHGVEVSDHRLRTELERVRNEARDQIMSQ